MMSAWSRFDRHRQSGFIFQRLIAYARLTKPKVVALIVFTALVGMLLAMPNNEFSWQIILFGNLGIGLCAGSAACFNQMLERRIDAHMRRTQQRPMVTGEVSLVEGVVVAVGLMLLGTFILIAKVNLLTTLLTLLSLVGYAVVYTAYLKHATPQNIVIGGAAGAAPPVLGWCAVTGEVHPYALLLFLLVFVWTPPHFWALAIHRRDEYAAAGVPMLPITHGVAYTSYQILLYSLLLFAVSLLPYATGMSGPLYAVGAAILGLRFIYLSYVLVYHPKPDTAWRTFKFSVNYLMFMFALLLLDRYLAI